jgi:hypothetical protein
MTARQSYLVSMHRERLTDRRGKSRYLHTYTQVNKDMSDKRHVRAKLNFLSERPDYSGAIRELLDK